MDKQTAIAAQTLIFKAMEQLYIEIKTDSRFHFSQKKAYTTLRNAANYIAKQVTRAEVA